MYNQGIHISIPQVLELRRVAAFCAERKYSIFFLPCHKSHIDYLTFSWLIFRLVSLGLDVRILSDEATFRAYHFLTS